MTIEPTKKEVALTAKYIFKAIKLAERIQKTHVDSYGASKWHLNQSSLYMTLNDFNGWLEDYAYRNKKNRVLKKKIKTRKKKRVS